jgi:ABC-type phosphate transport system substrate-binding protein
MLKKSLIAAACVLGLSFSAIAEVVIVVNKGNDSILDEKSVQRIFLGKENKFSNGQEAIPVNLGIDKIREDFDSNVLKRNSSQVSAYWSKLVFTGKGIPPKSVDDESTVLQLVKDNLNVIGYVDAANVTDDVRVITF